MTKWGYAADWRTLQKGLAEPLELDHIEGTSNCVDSKHGGRLFRWLGDT
jgi:hypothetical protein